MDAPDKVIRESDAMELVWEVAKRTGFSSKESTLFELLLKSCPRLEVDGEPVFRLVDLKGFLTNFRKAIETKDVSFLTQQRGLCVDRIVDVIEFVESPEFMGQRGYLRPRIKEALWELFSKEQYVEAVLCLRGNTRVPLLDGTMPTIRELSKLPPSERFWLYSQVDGKVVPAQGRFAHKTGRDVIWRVTFDDGTYIETNGRHRLVDVYGNKVMVKDLKPGDRLSSFCSEELGVGYRSLVDVQEGEFVEHASDRVVAGVGRLDTEDDVFCLTVDAFGVFFVQVEGGGDDGLYLNCVLSSNTGAIGVGKNYMADMALAYMLYRLSCYHNPQLEYDLAPGSSIFFIQQSITRTLAKKVVFEQFAERLKQSPYFQKHFPFDPQIKSELRFPKNIYVIPIGGSDTGALGMNVFGGIIDELNFMARVRDSVHTMYTGEEEYDQAEKLYSTLIRRMKSRFMQKGKLPGKLLLVSSTNYEGDFTDRKIEEAKTDKTIFVMKLSQWEALPDDRFSGEKFLVEVGNEYKQSRIISSREEAIDEEDVIEVPIEYKPEFERDINAALRDLAGIASSAKHPFIPYRELIVKCFETFEGVYGNRQLFKHDSVVLSNVVDPFAPDWELVVNMDYLEEAIVDRRQVFAVHIDIGLSQDAAGIAIGRINSYKLLPSTKYFNERTQEFVEVTDIRAPVYTIDGVMQVKAPPGGEVDLELLRDLVLFLRGELNVKWGTCDSYQSVMLLQSFRKARIRSGVLSVDTSLAPYSEVKMAIKEERLLFPRNEILWRELRELEKSKDKVDHLPGGSKDLADAVAGVVYILQRKEASYGRAARRRRSVGRVAEEDAVRRVRIGGQRRRSLHSIV